MPSRPEARRGMLSERVRLADLLAAVSVATDLGMGQEPEKAIRDCLVATALARRMGTAEADVSDVYYTALLRHLGCTATAHDEAYLGATSWCPVPRPSEATSAILVRPSPCCCRRGREAGSTGCGTLPVPCASGRRASRPF